MRAKIGKETGLWICPTSSRTAYRTFSEQQYFWNLYTSGRGNLAARPGTSNHGLGTTVDVATPAMRQAIDRFGASYGWSKAWSDAPSEWWHIRYDPGHDQHRGESVAPPKPDYAYLTGDETKARRRLLRLRRLARSRGGWKKNPRLEDAAKDAKGDLRTMRRLIRKAADDDGGWKKNRRRERYDALGKVLKG